MYTHLKMVWYMYVHVSASAENTLNTNIKITLECPFNDYCICVTFTCWYFGI